MDAYEAGKAAGVAGSYATEIMVAKIRAGQEVPASAWEHAANAILDWMIAKTRENTAQVPPTQAVQIQPPQPAPFDPQPAAPQPVQASQPVAQPSQPQPVLNGPPCPVCQTPTVPTQDYAAKKARNLSANPPKDPPPMWKCPLGSYDWKTKTAQGCQGAVWEEAA